MRKSPSCATCELPSRPPSAGHGQPGHHTQPRHQDRKGMPSMKVLLVGVGTVGEAIAKLSRGRPWLEQMVLADYDLDRARRVQAQVGDAKSHPAERIDAGDAAAVEALARAYDVDLVMNAVDPR